MGQDFLVVIFGVLALAIGIYIIWIGFFKSDKSLDTDVQEHLEQKEGQPIIPRSERQLDEVAVQEVPDDKLLAQDDALGNLAAVATSHSIQPQGQSHKEAQALPSSMPSAQEKASIEEKQEKQEKTQSDIVAHERFENTLDQPFEEQSPALNQHFRNQASERDNDVLLNHKDTITIIITPRNTFSGIDGSTILKLAKDYAMKYGMLKMFHRYESPEGTGQLWFSMLGVSHEGISGFDLVALPDLNYRALAMFLSLPHPQALKGFDSMVAVAQAIAAELDADIHDEDNFILDQSHFQAMRNLVASYQAS